MKTTIHGISLEQKKEILEYLKDKSRDELIEWHLKLCDLLKEREDQFDDLRKMYPELDKACDEAEREYNRTHN